MPKPTAASKDQLSNTGKMITSVMKSFFGVDIDQINKEGGLSVDHAIEIYNFNSKAPKLGIVSAAMMIPGLKELTTEQLTEAFKNPELAMFLAKMLENKDFREKCKKDFEEHPILAEILGKASEGTACENSVKYMLNPDYRPMPDSKKIATYPDKLSIIIDPSEMAFPWDKSMGTLETRADNTAAAYTETISDTEFLKYA